MNDWFEFCGKKSTTDYGVVMCEPPSIILPRERTSVYEVPGRSGDDEIRENAYDSFAMMVACYVRDASRVDEISAWLRQRGWLVLSTMPNRKFRARMINQIDIDKIVQGRDQRAFSIQFDCQPFRYLHPEADDIIATASGKVLPNPGNTASAPRIKIEGSGTFMVTVGQSAMFFEGVTGGIIVDSEMMDAFTLDAGALANDKMDGDFPEIPAGNSYVTWAVDTGSISRVTITPRWRFI